MTLVLGFASGLPLALSSGTLQAWLTVEGVDLKTLGWLTVLGLPYTYKFGWAPLLDRYQIGGRAGGRRRGWLVGLQLAMAGILFAISFAQPMAPGGLVWLASMAFLLVVFSASFDIVFDAWRAESLTPEQRGLGAAWSVIGYRIAMLVSGGMALMLADLYLGFAGTYRVMAGLCLVLATVAAFAPEPSNARPPASLRAAVVEPFREFFSRRAAWWLLAAIVLYKLGDAFAGSLSTAFLIRGAGFSAAEVGAVNKGMGLAATLIGGLAGGLLLARIGLWGGLFLFGTLQAVTNLGFWWLAGLADPGIVDMTLVVLLENLAGGMGTAAFVAFLMTLCDQRFTATQFALLSALASVGRVWVGPFAGHAATEWGWAPFFLGSFFAAIPGLLLLWWLRARIREMVLEIATPGQKPEDPGKAQSS
jgi:MFS transporter, PAT family, beta-lactamase induction signal transducer AmpG